MPRHFYFGDYIDIFACSISYYFFYLFLCVISSVFYSVEYLRIVHIIIIYQCLFAFGTDLCQFRIFLDFDSPSLIVRQMPVENVHLVHCQQVDKLVDILYRCVMTANVQHQSAMYKAGSVFDLYSRNRPVGFLLQLFSVYGGREKLINSLHTIEKSIWLGSCDCNKGGGDRQLVTFFGHTFLYDKADSRLSIHAFGFCQRDSGSLFQLFGKAVGYLFNFRSIGWNYQPDLVAQFEAAFFGNKLVGLRNDVVLVRHFFWLLTTGGNHEQGQKKKGNTFLHGLKLC